MTDKAKSKSGGKSGAGAVASKKPNTRGFTRPQTADNLTHIENVAKSVVPLFNKAQTETSAPNAEFSNISIPQTTVEESEYPTVVAPLSMLKVSKWNARKYVTGIDELAAEMEKEGQHTAAIGYYEPDGKTIVVIDGQRRLLAAISKGWPGLRVELQPAPAEPRLIYQISRSTNTHRTGGHPLDDAYMWQLLIDDEIYASQTDFVEKTGLDSTLVNRTLGLNTLPKVVIRMLVEKPELLKLRMLDAIKRYCDAIHEIDPTDVENAGENLILKIEKEELSSREVDEIRKALAKVPSKRIRNVAVPIVSAAGNGTLKSSNSTGKLNLDLNLTDPQRVEALVEKILGFVKAELDSIA